MPRFEGTERAGAFALCRPCATAFPFVLGGARSASDSSSVTESLALVGIWGLGGRSFKVGHTGLLGSSGLPERGL